MGICNVGVEGVRDLVDGDRSGDGHSAGARSPAAAAGDRDDLAPSLRFDVEGAHDHGRIRHKRLCRSGQFVVAKRASQALVITVGACARGGSTGDGSRHRGHNHPVFREHLHRRRRDGADRIDVGAGVVCENRHRRRSSHANPGQLICRNVCDAVEWIGWRACSWILGDDRRRQRQRELVAGVGGSDPDPAAGVERGARTC